MAIRNRITEMLGIQLSDRAGADGLDRARAARLRCLECRRTRIIETSSGELDAVREEIKQDARA